MILEEGIAYEQLFNRTPNNTSANESGLMLVSNQGGLLGLLTSFSLLKRISPNCLGEFKLKVSPDSLNILFSKTVGGYMFKKVAHAESGVNLFLS